MSCDNQEILSDGYYDSSLSLCSQDHKTRKVRYFRTALSVSPITIKFQKHCLYICISLTFRNHVKIFLSQNILHNVLNVVYHKTVLGQIGLTKQRIP